MPATYYVDLMQGQDTNPGTSEAAPLKTTINRTYLPGDRVLFKRGSVIRYALEACCGSADNPITYGAYGEGENPVFLGSQSCGDPTKWVEETTSVWRYTDRLQSEVCNMVYNNGGHCGSLCWEMTGLTEQGDWYYTGIGVVRDRPGTLPDEKLYICSERNPGHYYQDIECVLWGARALASGKSNIVFEDLTFKNSGVHGYQDSNVKNIHIRRCWFEKIGGSVWNKTRQIRFGNAVELWENSSNVTVENCTFIDIYDSGVTHQGADDSVNIPRNLYFRNNIFIACGMAAYECRGPAAQEVYFENNTCIGAGEGFSMQKVQSPRTSEIYPEPMGHHVFIWRIKTNSQNGSVFIRNNIFSKAPYGMAIYSMIHQEDMKWFKIDNNCYWQPEGPGLVRMNNRTYTAAQMSGYQRECGKDSDSIYADPMFVDEASGIWDVKDASPCKARNIGKSHSSN